MHKAHNWNHRSVSADVGASAIYLGQYLRLGLSPETVENLAGTDSCSKHGMADAFLAINSRCAICTSLALGFVVSHLGPTMEPKACGSKSLQSTLCYCFEMAPMDGSLLAMFLQLFLQELPYLGHSIAQGYAIYFGRCKLLECPARADAGVVFDLAFALAGLASRAWAASRQRRIFFGLFVQSWRMGRGHS